MRFQRVVKTSGKLRRKGLPELLTPGFLETSWPQREGTPRPPWILLFKVHHLLIPSREERQGINKMVTTCWKTAGEGK